MRWLIDGCHPLAASAPWTIDEANDACFIVKDHNGHALAYVYFENEPGHAHIWGSPWNVLQDSPEPENSPYPWSS
jgi:hypothetical protein